MLFFSNHNEPIDGIFHNNVFIKTNKNAIHLGVPLSSNDSNLIIKEAIDTFLTSVNGIMCLFPQAHSSVRYQLFKSYCMSLDGCVLWDLSSKYIQRFYVAWRKSVRYVLGLPYKTHSNLLPLVCNDKPINLQLYKRFIKFFSSIINNNNSVISLCGELALQGSNSSACNNLNVISYQCKIDKNVMVHKRKLFNEHIEILFRESNHEKDLLVAGSITDILQLRDLNNSQFTKDEPHTLLVYLGTDG